MSRPLGQVLKIIVSAGLLGLLLWRVDLAELGEVLAGTHPGFAVAALGLAHVDRALQGGKWWLLLRAAGAHLGLGAAIANTYVGNFAGQFLPSGVGGDFVRVALLRTSGIALSELVASIVVERVFGVLALFFTAAGAAVLAERAGLPVPEGTTPLVLASLAALLVVVALSFRFGIDGLLAWVARIGARFRLGERLGALTDAYRRYGKRKPAVLTYFALSIVEVLMVTGVFTLVAWAVGIRIPFPTMAILAPVTLFIQRIPISINGLGVQESVLAGFLVSLGWDLSEAVALGIALRISELLTLIPGAFLWMTRPRSGPAEASRGPSDTGR